MKANLTELKLGNGEEEAKIREWANKIQQDVKKYENVTVELKEALRAINETEKKQKEKFELESNQRKFEVKAELE